MPTPEILHVAPVVPVDEHHIEYALDRMKAAGRLYTSWLPTAMEQALLRNLPLYYQGVRREPVRLHFRDVHRQFMPDIRRSLSLLTRKADSVVEAHDYFFEEIDRRAAQAVGRGTTAVICREFGALHTFRAAHKAGAKCIYHLPTTHHQRLRQILDKESAQYPGVCDATFDPGEFTPRHLARKEEELALADIILCPSEFVKSSLLEAGVPEHKVVVIPFGSESGWLECKRPKSSGTFVLVGNISARKGAHRLIKAWSELGAHHTHQLLLVGDMHLSPTFLRRYEGTYRHLPKVNRDRLRDIYLSADALVLPALAEGFALVILEAMSCGTAILASNNSGAAGFLSDPMDARLFEAQDDDALKDTLMWAIRNPEALQQLGNSARQKAAGWTWNDFENRLISTLQAVLPT